MNRNLLRVIILLAALALSVFIILPGLSAQTEITLIPTITGQPERCLSCHDGIEEISASHPMEEFGCVLCHGGEALALDEDEAHTGMVRNPAALDVVQTFCGECHAGRVFTVQRSIMSTYAGAISYVRRAFGLQPDDVAHFATVETGHLQEFAVSETDLAPVQNFAANCLNCHFYSEPLEVDYFYRGAGCSGCHVPYDDDGLYKGGDPSILRDEAGHSARHEFATAISYTQCNHCHNRGNFDLRTMTFLTRNDLPAPAGLSDHALRLHEYYQPIGQFTLCEWELDCIDCHTTSEVMGDGMLYGNRADAQYVQCSTCHGTISTLPEEMVIEDEDNIALLRARLNPMADLEVGATVIVTERHEAFWHIQRGSVKWVAAEDNASEQNQDDSVSNQLVSRVRLKSSTDFAVLCSSDSATTLLCGPSETWFLTGKATGTRYEIPMVLGSACEQNPDQQESRYCHECHTYDRESLSGDSG